MKYKAMTSIGAGGCWKIAETKEDAIKGLAVQMIMDWSSIYDIRGAIADGEVSVGIYVDKGTKSHDDDVWLETVTMPKEYYSVTVN